MFNTTVFSNSSMLSLNGNDTGQTSIMTEPWIYRTAEGCIDALRALGEDKLFGNNDGKVYCNGTWDTVLCWPSVPADETIFLPCPPLPGLDPSKRAFRRCGPDGRWEGRKRGDYSNPRGYTNYIVCYTEEALKVYNKFIEGKSPEQKQMLKTIASGTRTMEIVGLSLSLVVSLISLFIFSYFRTLRCNRTRIHRNLFVSIIAQTVIRLVMYVDQIVARLKSGEIGGAAGVNSGTIFDTPVFCEAVYALIEYTKTVMFMWMLVEGVFLHNMIAVSVFSGKPNYVIFYIIGWGVPIPITLAWVITMAVRHQSKCWFSYYILPEFWIIEAPRLAVITVNLIFLLNIIRVLITKLQKSQTNEPHVTKVRKAVKAAIVLLPLLGITNFVVMTEPPNEVVAYGIWSYATYFLDSFQGFFISLLYCFLNGEVQMTIRKHWGQFLQNRMVQSSSFRRGSRSFSVFTSVTDMPIVVQRRQSSLPQPNGNVVPLLREKIVRDSRL